MPDASAAPRRNRRLLPIVATVVLVLIVAAVLMNRAGSAITERADLVQGWSAELDTWAAETIQRLGPEAAPAAHAHDLASLFDADLTQPMRLGSQAHAPASPGPEDVDTVNAACTAFTSYIDTVRDAVQPPAPPAGLDTEHPDAAEPVQRFDDYQRALSDAQQQSGAVESATRTFCGTYPALVAAHAGAANVRADVGGAIDCDDNGCVWAPGADVAAIAAAAEEAAVAPNELISASLSTQCYLPQLQPVCAADAAEAAELAQVWRTWSEEPDDDAAHLAQVGAVTSEAQESFEVAAADLGGSRADVLRTANEELTEIGTALTSAAEELARSLTTTES